MKFTLNNSIYILFLLSVFSFGQKETYVTYLTTSQELHELQLSCDSITIKRLYRHSLSPAYKFSYKTKKSNDSIYVLGANNNSINLIIEGEIFPKNSNKQFYIKKSKNELFFPAYNKPYFRKEYIDSLIGDYPIFAMNGKIYTSKRDSLLIQKDILGNKKIKKRHLKILKGKEAYNKYGAIGLNGVIEIKKRK